MESACSMVGCYNSSANLVPQQFYPFPRNFDLCMLWVQNCGRAELFEDFAYGGAQPFINRVICSDHFNSSDFIDPNCISKGIKHDVIPILNNCDEQADLVVVKEELEELDDSYEDDGRNEFIQSGSKIDNFIKQESVEKEHLYSTNSSQQYGESVQHFYPDEIEQGKLIVDPYMPLLFVSKEVPYKDKDADCVEFQKSQNAFRTAWKRALESAEQREARNRANALRNAFRRANETEDQRRARNQANALRNATRRANESEDEKKDRLYKNAVRAALRRSMESENEQKERRRKNALRAAFRRSAETEEQRAERRLKDKIRSAERRKRETDLQSKLRRYNDAVRAAFRRNNESDQQKQQRRMYDVMRAARRRGSENPEQRMKRLQADRERAAKRRMMKKLTHSVSNMQNTLFHDHGSSNSSFKSESNLEDNFSSDDDDLSNHSECTLSECDRVGNINVGEFNEHNFSDANNRNNFHAITTHLNNFTSFNSNLNIMNLPDHNLHNPNPSATAGEQPVNAAGTPEVVWCT